MKTDKKRLQQLVDESAWSSGEDDPSPKKAMKQTESNDPRVVDEPDEIGLSVYRSKLALKDHELQQMKKKN